MFIILEMFLLSGIMFVVSLFMLNMNCVYMIEWSVYNINSLNILFNIYIDWMGLMFFSIVLLISSMVILYSLVYISKNLMRFMMILMVFILSMMFLIFSFNIYSLMLGWDGLGLTSFCLVAFYSSSSSFSSSMITILMNRIGDIGLIMMISFSMMFGSWNLFMYNKMFLLMLILLLICGFTKSAQFPFSSWLPKAMAAPTPISSLVHSSTLVTAGVYLFIRYSKILSLNNLICLMISLFTMLVAGVSALVEYDLKKIVALSTLSQLGLMMFSLSMELIEVAFFHLIIHALFKSMLFLSVGVYIHSMNMSQDIRVMGMVFFSLPYTSKCFVISLLALMGFPFMSGFYSKDLIIEFMLMKMSNLMFLVLVFFYMILILTSMYSIRLIDYIYKKEAMFVNNSYYIKEDLKMGMSLFFLSLMSIFMGLVMFYNMFNLLVSVFLMLMMKAMIMMILVFGLYFFLLMNSINFINMKNNKVIYVISNMFMIDYFYLVYIDMLKLCNYMEKFDKFWLEEFLGEKMVLGMYKKLNYTMSKSFNIMMLFKVIMIFMLLMVLGFGILFYLVLESFVSMFW